MALTDVVNELKEQDKKLRTVILKNYYDYDQIYQTFANRKEEISKFLFGYDDEQYSPSMFTAGLITFLKDYADECLIINGGKLQKNSLVDNSNNQNQTIANFDGISFFTDSNLIKPLKWKFDYEGNLFILFSYNTTIKTVLYKITRNFLNCIKVKEFTEEYIDFCFTEIDNYFITNTTISQLDLNYEVIDTYDITTDTYDTLSVICFNSYDSKIYFVCKSSGDLYSVGRYEDFNIEVEYWEIEGASFNIIESFQFGSSTNMFYYLETNSTNKSIFGSFVWKKFNVPITMPYNKTLGFYLEKNDDFVFLTTRKSFDVVNSWVYYLGTVPNSFASTGSQNVFGDLSKVEVYLNTDESTSSDIETRLLTYFLIPNAVEEGSCFILGKHNTTKNQYEFLRLPHKYDIGNIDKEQEELNNLYFNFKFKSSLNLSNNITKDAFNNTCPSYAFSLALEGNKNNALMLGQNYILLNNLYNASTGSPGDPGHFYAEYINSLVWNGVTWRFQNNLTDLGLCEPLTTDVHNNSYQKAAFCWEYNPATSYYNWNDFYGNDIEYDSDSFWNYFLTEYGTAGYETKKFTTLGRDLLSVIGDGDVEAFAAFAKDMHVQYGPNTSNTLHKLYSSFFNGICWSQYSLTGPNTINKVGYNNCKLIGQPYISIEKSLVLFTFITYSSSNVASTVNYGYNACRIETTVNGPLGSVIGALSNIDQNRYGFEVIGDIDSFYLFGGKAVGDSYVKTTGYWNGTSYSYPVGNTLVDKFYGYSAGESNGLIIYGCSSPTIPITQEVFDGISWSVSGNSFTNSNVKKSKAAGTYKDALGVSVNGYIGDSGSSVTLKNYSNYNTYTVTEPTSTTTKQKWDNSDFYVYTNIFDDIETFDNLSSYVDLELKTYQTMNQNLYYELNTTPYFKTTTSLETDKGSILADIFYISTGTIEKESFLYLIDRMLNYSETDNIKKIKAIYYGEYDGIYSPYERSYKDILINQYQNHKYMLDGRNELINQHKEEIYDYSTPSLEHLFDTHLQNSDEIDDSPDYSPKYGSPANFNFRFVDYYINDSPTSYLEIEKWIDNLEDTWSLGNIVLLQNLERAFKCRYMDIIGNVLNKFDEYNGDYSDYFTQEYRSWYDLWRTWLVGVVDKKTGLITSLLSTQQIIKNTKRDILKTESKLTKILGDSAIVPWIEQPSILGLIPMPVYHERTQAVLAYGLMIQWSQCFHATRYEVYRRKVNDIGLTYTENDNNEWDERYKIADITLLSTEEHTKNFYIDYDIELGTKYIYRVKTFAETSSPKDSLYYSDKDTFSLQSNIVEKDNNDKYQIITKCYIETQKNKPLAGFI